MDVDSLRYAALLSAELLAAYLSEILRFRESPFPDHHYIVQVLFRGNWLYQSSKSFLHASSPGVFVASEPKSILQHQYASLVVVPGEIVSRFPANTSGLFTGYSVFARELQVLNDSLPVNRDDQVDGDAIGEAIMEVCFMRNFLGAEFGSQP